MRRGRGPNPENCHVKQHFPLPPSVRRCAMLGALAGSGAAGQAWPLSEWGGGLPGPPPGKGTRPQWALGALDVSPLVGHLCSGDQAMRFRKNPFLPARLPVTAPAEASKRLGPAPAPWDSHRGRRGSVRAVLCSRTAGCPHVLPVATPHRPDAPPHHHLRPLSAAPVPSHGPARPSGIRVPDDTQAWAHRVVVASAPATGSRQQASGRRTGTPLCPGCPWAWKQRGGLLTRLQQTPRAVTSPSRRPVGPTAPHPSTAHPENRFLRKLPSAERLRGEERGERPSGSQPRGSGASQDRRAAASSAPRVRLPSEGGACLGSWSHSLARDARGTQSPA